MKELTQMWGHKVPHIQNKTKEEKKKLKNKYYTIMMKTHGLPDYFNKDISEDEDCFIFDTEKEANDCLKLIFNNGKWIDDEQYGKVRYYVEQVTY